MKVLYCFIGYIVLGCLIGAWEFDTAVTDEYSKLQKEERMMGALVAGVTWPISGTAKIAYKLVHAARSTKWQ